MTLVSLSMVAAFVGPAAQASGLKSHVVAGAPLWGDGHYGTAFAVPSDASGLQASGYAGSTVTGVQGFGWAADSVVTLTLCVTYPAPKSNPCAVLDGVTTGDDGTFSDVSFPLVDTLNPGTPINSGNYYMYAFGMAAGGQNDYASIFYYVKPLPQQATSVVANADGRLEAFVSQKGTIYHIAQNTPACHGCIPTWGSWAKLTGLNVTAMQPVAILNALGEVQVFAVGTDNKLYTISQNFPGGTWGSWMHLNGTWPTTSNIAVVNNDGALEVFMVGQDGALWSKYQNQPEAAAARSAAALSETWTTSWTYLGLSPVGSPHASWLPTITVGLSPVNGVEVFGAVKEYYPAPYQVMYKAIQNPGDVLTLGTPIALGGIWPMGAVLSLTPDADGNLYALTVGRVGELYQENVDTCSAPNCWTQVSAAGVASIGQTFFATNRDGQLEVFTVPTSGGSLYTAFESTPGATMTSFVSLGGNWPAQMTAAMDINGSLDVFGLGRAPAALWHTVQPVPGSWSGFKWGYLGKGW